MVSLFWEQRDNLKEKWVIAAKKADFNGIGKRFGIDPVVARIMRNRGLTEPEEMERYLHGDREDLYDPHLLKDVDLAAQIVLQKIREGKKIRIIGDYDIDGIQSTYILLKGLERLGAEADFVIPDRIQDGYGLNEHLVTRACEEGADTILTCDNGISAMEQIALAKELGMTVVVTDHHEVPFEETSGGRRQIHSAADAVVNPKQEDCPYPFKGLCGAAVAFKFLQVLYEQAGIPVSEADVFLENVGFATVGDVMDLQDENRILVRIGLKLLQHTENIGMRALILQNNLEAKQLKSYHIGFILGPCLNASGRLETARLSLQLLLCENPAQAAVIAREVVELNASRKLMTVFTVTGILILLMAVFNYISMSVAQTSYRAKEMATRRLLGSSSKDIFWRMMAESLIMTFIAFALAFLLAKAVEPFAMELLKTKLDVAGDLTVPVAAVYIAGILLLSAVSSGKTAISPLPSRRRTWRSIRMPLPKVLR